MHCSNCSLLTLSFLRRTAYFVIGLISSTLEGVEMLEEFGWESVCTPLGGATGLCVPMDLANFVHVSFSSPVGFSTRSLNEPVNSQTPLWAPPPLEVPESLLLAAPSNHLEREALAAFANLSNHILATKASKSLARLKSRHRDLFSSPSLYYRALEMLANHHYRLPVRRYVIELFDIALDDRTAEAIMAAGEDLKARQLDEKEGEVGRGEGWKPPTMDKAVKVILDGIEGGFSDEDDDDESSLEEGTTVIPLRVLQPLLTIRGFLLS